MARIILFGGEKGGTGKTTLATNISGILALYKKKVLLVDTDKQGSSSPWCSLRDTNEDLKSVFSMELTGIGIAKKILSFEASFDYVIIDAGGRDSFELRESLGIADVAFIPFKPSQFDIWTAEKMSSVIAQASATNDNLISYIVINMASTHYLSHDVSKSIAALKEFENIKYSNIVVKMRTAYMAAPELGMTVFELPPKSRSEKAIEEMKQLIKLAIA